MSFVSIILFISAILTPLVLTIPDYSGLPPGPHCEGRYDGCCPGRQDECSAPIAGTLCYCDDFCNRTRSEDCCPDFWSFCKGESPPDHLTEGCSLNGQTYGQGQSIQKNCNKCICQPTKVGNVTLVEFFCEEDPCLINPDIVQAVNDDSYVLGWHASNYSDFWGRKLEEGLEYKLGTLHPHRVVMTMNPVRRMYDPASLPRHFDATEKWYGQLTPIQDQKWCGSSWALSTVAVASDRFAIMSKGMEEVTLSAQHLLSCNNRGQQSCKGGHLDRAWLFLRKYGLVDEECYPYKGTDSKCRLPRGGNLLTARCTLPVTVDRKEMYKTGPAYRLGNETDIMDEILESGPVQATMRVYQDFFSYSKGIYRHSSASTAHRTKYHSVRIVGWGEEGRVKYWKVANSWGPEWGENGYFRIVRGVNECEIESFVLAAWAKTIDLSNNVEF